MAAADSKFPFLMAHSKSPLLMLPGGGYDDDDGGEYRNIYRLSDHKISRLHLPDIRSWRFLGSSDGGWMVAMDDQADLHIINPLITTSSTSSSSSSVHHRLPPTSTFSFLLGSERNPDNGQTTGYYMNDGSPPEPAFFDMEYMRKFYVFKAVFFPSASITIAIHGIRRTLAFARPGDESWNQIDLDRANFDDVIIHKGVFYAVTLSSYTVGLDLSGGSGGTFKIAFEGPHKSSQTTSHFLVESGDNLLLLCRKTRTIDWEPDEKNYDCPSYVGEIVQRTESFEVYKLDPINSKWIELKNLGEVALFVGNNQSTSLSTKDLPQIKGNSVYFTEDDYEAIMPVPHARRDMGVFSLEDGTVEPFFPHDDSLLHRLNWPPPIWIMPSLSS